MQKINTIRASRVIIIGCGDIGRRMLKQWGQQGGLSGVHACVRSNESLAACEAITLQQTQAKFLGVDLDDDSQASLKIMFQQAPSRCDVLYYFAPPAKQGLTDHRLQRVLMQLSQHKLYPMQCVLISTTGVYGDCAGQWVDETSLTNPTADRAKRRLDAEKQMQDWCAAHEVPYVILRVPGIYAHDRLPVARIREAKPVLEAGIAPYTNRIHADDLARLCIAVHQQGQENKALSNQIINACDGKPSTMTEYFNRVADYLGLPQPPQVGEDAIESGVFTAGMSSYLRESRKVSADKLKRLLDFEFIYPDLEAGLTDYGKLTGDDTASR